MKTHNNNLASRYAFIVCLSIMLLFSQTFQAHMHLQHNEHAAQESGHVIDIHVVSSFHDSAYDTHHQDDFITHHDHPEVDVSVDSLVKKIGKINFSLLLFLVVGFILTVPLLLFVSKYYLFKIKSDSLYYFLNPPLRAPPK